MAVEIRPLTGDDIPELSRFLSAGFHAPPQADFTAPEVLRWKYLEPVEPISAAARGDGQSADGCEQLRNINTDAPRSYVAWDEAGRIVGHIGLCRTAFVGRAITFDCGRVATIHIIDWLGSPGHRSLGLSLMRQAHEGVPTQFGWGSSQVVCAIGERAGYELRGLVSVYTRVFRPGYWLCAGRSGLAEVGMQLARDAVSLVTRQSTRAPATIVLQRVSTFGSEILPVMTDAKAHAILTDRDPARLNAFLRFPRQTFSGWHLHDDGGRLRGFALLNLVPMNEGRMRTGKIVDCLLDDVDVARWHGAMLALMRELARQGADLAQVYASTPWEWEALRRSGYVFRFTVKFNIRDPSGLIPRGATFHLTALEGDYAYT